MNHFSFEELPDAEQKTTLKLQRSLSEKGTELTPEQVVDACGRVFTMFSDCTGINDLGGIINLCKEYYVPSPPYDGFFDDEKEAECFAKNARECGHEVAVVQTGPKRFQVLSV